MSYMRVANGAVAVSLVYGAGVQNIEGGAHYYGEIIAVGDGVPWLRKGDTVLFRAANATRVESPAPVKISEEQTYHEVRVGFYVVDQREIHGVFEFKKDQVPHNDDMVSL